MNEDRSEPVYYGKTVTKPNFSKPGQDSAFFFAMCAAAQQEDKRKCGISTGRLEIRDGNKHS